MSAKKKAASNSSKPSQDLVTLSDVDLALIMSEVDKELSRLGVSVEPAALPKYGYDDLEMQRTQLYPNINEKLYFSSDALEGLTKKNEAHFDAGLEAAEKDEADNEENRRLQKIMQKSRLKDLEIEKKAQVALPKSKSQLTKEFRQKRDETAGSGWYNLKAPTMTPELEQDLKLVQLRSFVDPKKFFKRQKTDAPKHFEVGTMVAGPMDFYSDGRNKAKPTKAHFVDTLIEDQEYKKFAKRRYREIQNARTGLKAKRKGGDVKNTRPQKKAKKF